MVKLNLNEYCHLEKATLIIGCLSTIDYASIVAYFLLINTESPILNRQNELAVNVFMIVSSVALIEGVIIRMSMLALPLICANFARVVYCVYALVNSIQPSPWSLKKASSRLVFGIMLAVYFIFPIIYASVALVYFVAKRRGYSNFNTDGLYEVTFKKLHA